MSDPGDVVRTDGRELQPEELVVDPRCFPTKLTPAVVEELHADDTTTKVSFADVSVLDSGVLRWRQFDGVQGFLPEWRWSEVTELRTETFTDRNRQKRRRRVSPADWHMLPETVREAFDRPGEEALRGRGGDGR